MAWAPPLPATLLSQWTSRRSGGASRGLNAVSQVACCINRALRLHQPAPPAASVSGDALPGSARTFRSKHPGATLGACPGATRAARRPAGSRTALYYVLPAPVRGSSSMPYRRRHAVSPGHPHQPAPLAAFVSGVVLQPATRRYCPCGVNPHRLGARGAGDMTQAHHTCRPPGATAARSQTSPSRCPGAPYGGSGPDCVADVRDLTVTAHRVT